MPETEEQRLQRLRNMILGINQPGQATMAPPPTDRPLIPNPAPGSHDGGFFPSAHASVVDEEAQAAQEDSIRRQAIGLPSHESMDRIGPAPIEGPDPSLPQPAESPAPTGLDQLRGIISPEAFSRAQQLAEQQGFQADDEARAKQLNRLRSLKSISEGLGKIGNIPVTGDILMHTNWDKPYVDEDTRNRIDEFQDQLSEADRATLKGVLGHDVPKGMTFTRMEKFLPGLAAVIRGREGDASREKVAEMTGGESSIAAGRLDVARGNLEARNKGLGQSQTRLEMPSPDTGKKVADYDYMLGQITDIRDEYKQGKGYIGPLAGRWQNFLGKLGLQSPEATKLMSDIDALVFQNLYDLSGKQINEAERRDLKQTMATAYQNGASFEAALDNVEDRIRLHRKTVLNTEEARGKNVGKMRDIEPGTGAQSADQAQPGEIKVRIKKTGEVGFVPAGEFDGQIYERVQ